MTNKAQPQQSRLLFQKVTIHRVDGSKQEATIIRVTEKAILFKETADTGRSCWLPKSIWAANYHSSDITGLTVNIPGYIKMAWVKK